MTKKTKETKKYGIKELVVPAEKFHFDKFIAASLRFNKKIGSSEIHPSAYISKVASNGEAPEEAPETGWGGFNEDLKAGKALFFPFAGPNTGEKMDCADGKKLSVDDEVDEFTFGDSDVVGLFVTLQKGSYKINPAVYCMMGMTCNMPGDITISDCGKFNAPMRAWAEKFIKK